MCQSRVKSQGLKVWSWIGERGRSRNVGSAEDATDPANVQRLGKDASSVMGSTTLQEGAS